MVGGFLIALVLIGGALFAGNWFHSAIVFQDAHSLDAARTTKPTLCSFSFEDNDQKTIGQIHSRDGILRFDITEWKNDVENVWGIEINMHDTSKMMSQASPGEPYVSLNDYPDLRVQVLENLKEIMLSEKIHCVPWWSANGFRFALDTKFS